MPTTKKTPELMETQLAEELLATVGAPATTWTPATAWTTTIAGTQETSTAEITLAIYDLEATSEAKRTSQDLSNVSRDASSISRDAINISRDASSISRDANNSRDISSIVGPKYPFL
jgi:hypothetical protein